MFQSKARTFLKCLFFFSLSYLGSHLGYSTNYYFSLIEGDDARNSFEARNPTTPWKSLSKLNSVFHSLSPGDTVFLKRGEEFPGSIHLAASGTAQMPIVISAYGVGEAPVISGWTKIDQWHAVENGVYRSDYETVQSKANILLVDDLPQPLGRYPDQGYLEYALGEADNTLIAEHDFSSLDLTGSTLVVRKNQWILDKHQIVASEGKNIRFAGESKYKGSDGYGFFIQDNKDVLNVFGEWCNDPQNKAVSIFIGDELPSQYQIKVSTTDNLLTNAKDVQHVVVENLRFSGANESGIFLQDASAIEIKNCFIEYSGENALTGLNVRQLTVADNHIFHSQNNGINLRYGTPHATIQNNVITNTHVFPGMGSSGDGNGIGIYSLSDYGHIVNNRITETGYSGIVFNGDRTAVKNNYINSFCLVKNDGGGIYTYEGSANRQYQGRRIEGNIIVNGRGTREGARMSSQASYPQAEGIYIDDNANGIEVKNNSIAHVSRNAINIHNARNIIVQQNTAFNGHRQLFISHDDRGEPVRDVRILNNLFFANAETQVLVALSSTKDDLTKMAVFRDNLYVRPKDHVYAFQLNPQKESGEVIRRPYTFAQWKEHLIDDQGSAERAVDGFSISVKNPRVAVQDKDFLEMKCLDADCQLEPGVSAAFSEEGTRVSTTKNTSGLKIDVGPIDPQSQYLLRLKVSSKGNLVVSAALRHSRAPWSYLSPFSTFNIAPGSNGIEKVFSNPDESQHGAVILTFQSDENDFVVHKATWMKADVSFTAPHAMFEYNATVNSKEVELGDCYIDIEQNRSSEKILLPPFTSKILIKTN